MYNPLLKTFCMVAETLSFSKAAERLYMTPPGVIKQINTLEEHIGVTLFVRTHRGLKLTAAGNALYNESLKLIDWSDRFLQRIRSMEMDHYLIRIAISTKTSTLFLRDIQKVLMENASQFRFKLIPYSITPSSVANSFKDLGSRYDIIPGIYDEENIKTRNCEVLPLFKAHLCCAISQDNPLSEKGRIAYSDLKGNTVMIIKRGWNIYADQLRDLLESRYPDIHWIEFPLYNVETFNECQNNNHILITTDAWSPVHPLLKLVQFDALPEIPYGLMYSKNALEPVRQLVTILKDNLASRDAG
ncbi:MAG: hypothetical protein ACFWT7_07595 [Succiniclasticum sp.]|jgi:DNA-binding transcriptional LysR family regulator